MAALRIECPLEHRIEELGIVMKRLFELLEVIEKRLAILEGGPHAKVPLHDRSETRTDDGDGVS